MYETLEIIWDDTDSCHFKTTSLSSDDSATIFISYDKDINKVILELYQDVRCASYPQTDSIIKNTLRDWWFRIKTAFRILKLGYIREDGYFYFRDYKHIKDYATLINNFADRIYNENRKREIMDLNRRCNESS